MTFIRGAQIALAMAAAAVVTVVGYAAFIGSIHNPGPVQSVVQWAALPLFSAGVALGVVHGDLSAWLTIIASFALWSCLFVFLFSSRWWSRLDYWDQRGSFE